MIFNTTISVQSLVFLVFMRNHCYQVGIKEVLQLVLQSMLQASRLKQQMCIQSTVSFQAHSERELLYQSCQWHYALSNQPA